MKKLLLSSVMMLFLCAVSFAQTEKLAIKLSARMEASKKAQQAQDVREQEKLLEVQKAKKSTAPNDPATAQTNKLKMADLNFHPNVKW